MPRQARIDASGALHHVIVRGIERRHIFDDATDRTGFLDRMTAILPETMTACFAWAFLTNHIHLLLRTGKMPLSKVMARILTGYVVSYNKRHRRHGPLFQNRYKSILCQEDTYLMELVRYIHLNPLRAGIVENLNGLLRYRWCGHRVLMGKVDLPFQDSNYVLGYFGDTRRKAQEAYLSFMEAGIGQGERHDLIGGGLIRSYGGWKEIKNFHGEDRLKGDERILGDSAFVLRVLSDTEEKITRRTSHKLAGMDIDGVERKIITLFDISHDDLISRRRRAHLVEARSIFCYWTVAELGIPATTIARYLAMTQPGVGYAVERGKRIAEEKCYRLKEELS
jgi:putative transposase